MKIPLKPLDLEHLMYIHQTTSSSRSCILLMSLVMSTHLKCPWNYQQPLGKKKKLSIKEEQQSPSRIMENTCNATNSKQSTSFKWGWQPQEITSSIIRRKCSPFCLHSGRQHTSMQYKRLHLQKIIIYLFFEHEQQKVNVGSHMCMCHFCQIFHLSNNSKHSLKCFKT